MTQLAKSYLHLYILIFIFHLSFFSQKNDLFFYVAHFQIKQKNQITNKRLTEECWNSWSMELLRQKQHKLSDQDS